MFGAYGKCEVRFSALGLEAENPYGAGIVNLSLLLDQRYGLLGTDRRWVDILKMWVLG